MCLRMAIDQTKPVSSHIYWKMVKSTMKPPNYAMGNGKYILNKVYKSDRKGRCLSPTERDNGKVNHGIHVFTSLQEALQHKYSKCIILEVVCMPEDFVAWGINDEAVYTKVLPIRIVKK